MVANAERNAGGVFTIEEDDESVGPGRNDDESGPLDRRKMKRKKH